MQNLGLIVAALATAVVLGQIIIPNILLVSFRSASACSTCPMPARFTVTWSPVWGA